MQVNDYLLSSNTQVDLPLAVVEVTVLNITVKRVMRFLSFILYAVDNTELLLSAE